MFGKRRPEPPEIVLRHTPFEEVAYAISAVGGFLVIAKVGLALMHLIEEQSVREAEKHAHWRASFGVDEVPTSPEVAAHEE